MSLQFRDKKKRWPPSKPVQYILACTLLVLALLLLGTWLFIRFVYTEAPPDTEPQDSSSIDNEPGDTSYCLINLEDVGYERFALVETSPKENAVTVTPIDPSYATAEGELYALLKKQGLTRTAQIVGQTMNIPTLHYLSFSISDAETLFTRLGENLSYALPEAVSYKDENGATVRLPAEEQKLTPTQIAALLRYTQWENTDHEVRLVADLTVALINQCLRPNKSLKGYFELLSNTSVTDLRIDQFNAYSASLEYLAANNDGTLAQRAATIPN